MVVSRMIIVRNRGTKVVGFFCSICHEKIEPSNTDLIEKCDCGDIFHKQCAWVYRGNTCPKCGKGPVCPLQIQDPNLILRLRPGIPTLIRNKLEKTARKHGIPIPPTTNRLNLFIEEEYVNKDLTRPQRQDDDYVKLWINNLINGWVPPSFRISGYSKCFGSSLTENAKLY